MKTLILKISDPKSEQLAVDILKSGGVIALPTDTVYGLACSATNSAAIAKLYSIKTRNENKPVAICVGNETDIKKTASVQHLPVGLLNALLPGPVTLVLNCINTLDKSLVFKSNVAIRIPDYNFIRNIAIKLDQPIALTSANISSQPSTVNINEFSELWGQLDGIFDGGNLGDDRNRAASTIVDLSGIGSYKIIREGMECKETSDICAAFGLILRTN